MIIILFSDHHKVGPYGKKIFPAPAELLIFFMMKIKMNM